MMTKKNWVGGDGGPLVVLQATAAAKWQGASDFDHCLMNGGDVETDYDAICGAEDYVIRRYDRDMLVLLDSEWSGRPFVLSSGAVGVVQVYCMVEDLSGVLKRIAQSEPERSFPFCVEDDTLRLLVGADDGNGETYGFVDIPIVPGNKKCDMYDMDAGIIFIVSDEQA